MMGLPAAGKTTIAKQLGEQLDTTRITFDEWPGIWTTVRNKHDSIYRYVLDLSKEKTGKITLLDDTMHLASMRKRYWKLSESMRMGICFIYIKEDLETVLVRNSKRSGSAQVKEQSIIRIHESFEDLTRLQRSFAIIAQVGGNIDCKNIQRILKKSREYFSFRPTNDKAIVVEENSLAHRINLTLNKAAHLYIASLSHDEFFETRRDNALRAKNELFTLYRKAKDENVLGILQEVLIIKLCETHIGGLSEQ